MWRRSPDSHSNRWLGGAISIEVSQDINVWGGLRLSGGGPPLGQEIAGGDRREV